jgi:hypothetical protein
MLFAMLGGGKVLVLQPSHAPGTGSRKELLAQSRELPAIAQMRNHAFRDAGDTGSAAAISRAWD